METRPRAPLGLVHGYGFAGAGSNLWTRSMARALCKLGHDIHIVCQESRPENYEFVSEAVAYDGDATPRRLFSRESPYPGRCTIHRPDLEVLPVYVSPRTTSTYVRPIPSLDDNEIEDYVRRNANVLQLVAKQFDVVGFCVNHVVLSSVAAQRAKAEAGVPYAVLPHGSAIEYVVKKDERMLEAATSALADADLVFALNGEMEQRVRDVFGNIPGIEQKLKRLPVGVDTEQFIAGTREQRPALIDELIEMISEEPRGRTGAQQADLRARLRGNLTETELRTALSEGTDYVSSAPDGDLEAHLHSFGWEDALVVLFVGRLTASKGAPTVVIAFPDVLARHPSARLVLAGTGALREALEALVWALAKGEADLARLIVEIGAGIESTGHTWEPFVHAYGFIEKLEREGLWDEYVRRASDNLEPEHVLFTGFVDHGPLSRLYAIADIGVFPSVVREASPLVVPEAAASGTLPIGTDFGGMGDSLRTLGENLPPEMRHLLTVRYDPDFTVMDLIDRLNKALQMGGTWSEDLRRAAVDHYDWQSIAERLATTLTSFRKKSGSPR